VVVRRPGWGVVLLAAAALVLGRPGAPAAAAAPPESLFVAGNAAYEAGDYLGAVDRYMAVRAAGVVDADLYYNLGNAWFKSGDLGRAVLWYERARRLDPRNPDVRANLAVVRSLLRDKDLAPREGGLRGALTAWHRNLSVAESVAVASILYALLGLIGVCAVFRQSSVVTWLYARVSWLSPARLFGLDMKQDFLLAITVTFVLAAAFAGSSYRKIRGPEARARGVVVAEEVSVFSAPSRDATVQFKVHEGTIVSLREARTGWVQVDLPGDLSGWVDTGSVEGI
jgi:tetratricopeptide (TPR) repeat protein